MDCNKDEAVRAKEIAEKKLIEKEISGAKRFAFKAQTLFPELEGLSQFQDILDVYTASERKVNGLVDWYEVLGVDPLADDEAIRKRYRKLALALHPDKNKAVGADGAFKILCEAWSLLSDKVKRAVYDQKRNIKTSSHNNVSGQNQAKGVEKNAWYNATNSSWAAKNFSAPSNPQTDFTPSRSNANSFWTSCNRCMMRYEYFANYRNLNLLCPNCRQPFLATEIPPPAKCNGLWQQYQKDAKQQSGRPANNASSDSGRKFAPAPKLETPGFPHLYSRSGENIPCRSIPTSAKDATQPAHNFQSTRDYWKRGREEAFSGMINLEGVGKKSNTVGNTDSIPTYNGPIFSKGEKPAKKKRVDHPKATLGRKNLLNQIPLAGASSGSNNNCGNQVGRSETEKLIIPGADKSRSSRELSPSKTRSMLMEKARMEIRKKLQEWNAAKVDKEMLKDPCTKGEHMSFQPKRFVGVRISDGRKESSHSASAIGSGTEANEAVRMSVPDPEFYNFDEDRMVKVFAANQVWAAYDDEDGMPRYYAIIHAVISRKPFIVRFSWLNSKCTREFGSLNWVNNGFPKTCGYFRTGKKEVNKNLASFSHQVKWAKGPRGAIRIFPEKGDVWALYRNWSSDWNARIPDDVVRKYDMVEVVGDYSEEQGVAVVPLVKVAGFRSVFRQHEDSSKVYTIPKEEMFRLSHQVPSYIITGHESEIAPKGCRELDTAAMPLELLQVIKEARVAEGGRAAGVSAMGDAETKMTGGDGKEVMTKRILVYSRRNKGKNVVGETSGGKKVTL